MLGITKLIYDWDHVWFYKGLLISHEKLHDTLLWVPKFRWFLVLGQPKVTAAYTSPLQLNLDLWIYGFILNKHISDELSTPIMLMFLKKISSRCQEQFLQETTFLSHSSSGMGPLGVQRCMHTTKDNQAFAARNPHCKRHCLRRLGKLDQATSFL